MAINALYVLNPVEADRIYGPEEREAIARRVNVLAEPLSPHQAINSRYLLREVEIIFSGWGGPVLDEQFLAAAPKLKAFFYGAGTVRALITDGVWQRGIVVVTAWVANAVPVAEFTVSMIVLALKDAWRSSALVRHNRNFHRSEFTRGTVGATVGLVSLGAVGRMVAQRLREFDLKVLLYDPFATSEDAKELGAEIVELGELFSRSDVVGLHTPWLKETEGLIQASHLRRMKRGAALINTARGAVIDEAGMIEVLRERPDLIAFLDVTHPEPPVADSPLYDLENVILTPHIAGAQGLECRRLGRYMIEELDRYLAGEKLKWQITRERIANMA